ncbi:MAG: hypothetical protein MUC87_16910 [Bacteroidia bacterium]|jgi:hypothetical protein|nr:hypothetical protein [Bacteroidia bacterium]
MKALVYFLTLLLVAVSCKSKKSGSGYVPPATTTTTTTPPRPPGKPEPNDMRVVIHEEMLNKMLAALGNISGKEPYSALLMKDTCFWTLIGPKIRLHPGKADFEANVNVKAGPFNYTTPVKGNVAITYDRVKNVINVKIETAVVELYTKFLGKKIHIKDIDLADQFAEPFTFDGPTATESEMEFPMPDGTTKVLLMRTSDCDLSVVEDMILVPCEMEFLPKPGATPKPAPKPAPKK